jgi:hypothetical protein
MTEESLRRDLAATQLAAVLLAILCCFLSLNLLWDAWR